MAGPVPALPPGFTLDPTPPPTPLVPDTPTLPEGYQPDPRRPGAVTPIPGGPKDPNAPGTSLTPGALDDATSRLILTGQMDPMGMGGGPVRVQILNNRDAMLKKYGITDQQLPAIRSQFEADSKAYSQRTQQASFQKQALEAAQQHFSQIAQDLDKLPAQTDSTALNAVSNFTQRQFSGRTITDLDAEIPLFQAEIAKIMTANPSTGAGNLTDAARQEFDVLNSSRDPAARKEAMQKILQMAQEKIAGDDQEMDRLSKRIGGGLASYASIGSANTPSPPPNGTTQPPTGTQHFKVKAPDGRVYEFDAPANATPEQLDAMTRAAAGFPKDYPVKGEGIAGQFLDATKNDLAGIAQGVAALPDLAAKTVGKVVSVIPTAIGYGLDQLGYGGAAGYARGIAHDLANPVQIENGIESIAPTPDTPGSHAARTVGQIIGGAVGFPGSAAKSVVSRIVGEVPQVPTMAERVAGNVIQDANAAKVPVLTSDVRPPQTFIGKAAQAIGERIPITGTGPVRAAQQAARVAAVKSAAQDFGAATGDELNSPAIDSVAQDLAQQRSAQLTKLTNQKNAVINGTDGAVPAPNAIAAINEQIAKLSGINKDAFAPVIAKLEGFRDQLASGKSLAQIEGNRKLLGDMFADPSLASIRGDGEKALSAIYGPLREDMGNFIKANGKPGDFNKWQSANDALAGMVGDLKNTALKRSLNTADSTPENVASLLFSSKPSDVRTLYAGLSPAGRAKAQAAIIQRAVEKAGGMENLSPERFASQIKSLGNSVGVFFNGADADRIQGLQRVLQITQRASQAGVAPPTGVQAVPYAMGAGFTEMFGVPGGISAALGTGLLARAYESVPVRTLLMKLGQSKPGTQQERYLFGRITNAVSAAVQKPIAAPTALNANVPAMGALAASPDQRPNQQQ